jgi:hypothetical protein
LVARLYPGQGSEIMRYAMGLRLPGLVGDGRYIPNSIGNNGKYIFIKPGNAIFSKIEYYLVEWQMTIESIVKRAFGALEKIFDNYPK